MLCYILIVGIWLTTLSAFALLIEPLSKDLKYRAAVLILSLALIALSMRGLASGPITDGVVEKKVTMQITYENGIPIDSVIVQ